jgi:protein-disulfide isomerase
MENNNKLDQKQIAGAIMIAGLLIAGAILMKGRSSTLPAPMANNPVNLANIKIKPVSSTEHILGNPNARVVIVEYSDSECPFCKVFHETMHAVMSKYGDKVAWVYRQYPIPSLHPKAPKESEAMECAWEQGGNDIFWKFTNQVFVRTNSNNSLDPAELPKIAGELGLDVKAFNSCVTSGKYTDKVDSDISDGEAAGVSGTPSSFILVDGKLVDTIQGAYPFQDVVQKIDAVLK